MRRIFDVILGVVTKAYLEPSLELAKVKGAIYYLQAIKAARRVVILICLLLFVVTMIGAGLVLIPLALILWAPWPLETKVIVGVVVGGLYLFVPVISIAILLSQKRWMRMTGADAIVRDILSK